MTTSYKMIDRFLRQNLSDKDYPSHKEALDAMCSQLLQRTTPPQRTWVGLTDEEIYMNCPNWLSQEQCKVWIQQVEAKLKQANGYAEENT